MVDFEHAGRKASRIAQRPARTVEFICLFSLITSLTPISIDALLPALRDIGLALNVADANDTQLIVSMLILGMVFGELVFGPLADALGRRAAIVGGLTVFAVGTIVAMTATSLEQMLVGRIIQGFGVAGSKIGTRALIRDRFGGDAMARVLSFIFMILVLVPMLAPAIGKAINDLAGWRAVFVLYLVLGVVILVWLLARQPETLTPERRIALSFRTLVGNTALIVRHPRVMAYTIAMGLVFGAQLLFISMAQAMFFDLYDVDDAFPIYFAVLALAMGAASFSNSQLVMRHGMHRLSVVAATGLSVASVVALIGSAPFGGAPPFAPFMIVCCLLFFFFALVFGNLNAMAMHALGRVAGLGASLIASLSSLIAVILAVAAGRLYDQTVYAAGSGFLLAGVGTLGLVIYANSKSNASI